MTDPKIALMGLLSDNWDDDNTSSITPTFSTGWYDSKSKKPQVTITDPSETPLSRGEAPFFGLVTSGGPVQYMMNTLAANVWVERKSVAINPKQAVYEMKEEIARILLANYTELSDLDYIAWLGGNEIVETDPPPPVYRYAGAVGYGYLKT